MMNKFWEDIMNCLLGVVLYHGQLPDEEMWCKQYEYEVKNMIEDIQHFHASNKDAGIEISNDAMASFLVFTENEHIGNTQFVNKCVVDEMQLLTIASKINDELN